jgi:RNA polymerase sigma-70 factor (ECF subfamily)
MRRPLGCTFCSNGLQIQRELLVASRHFALLHNNSRAGAAHAITLRRCSRSRGEIMIAYSTMVSGSARDGRDAWLARRTQAGDSEAFTHLATPYLQRGLAVAARILGSRDDAQDVLQEALIAAFTHIHRFDTTRTFEPWFVRIVVRKALNAIEQRKRRYAIPLPDTLVSTIDGPDRSAENREFAEDVVAALSGLTPRQRNLVELVEIRGLSQTEAAESLGISHATARWHLHEARARLRALLAVWGQVSARRCTRSRAAGETARPARQAAVPFRAARR